MLGPRAELLLPVAAVGVFCWMAWVQGVCIQDDAYVAFRYAQNLVEGHGLVYNPGERVEGYTNFLWTMILAGGMRLGADPVPLSRMLGIAFGAGIVALTWVFAGLVANGSRSLRFAACLLVALTPPFFAEAAMGLETSMFTFLVLVGCLVAISEFTRDARWPWHALILAAAALARPEGVLAYGLVLGGLALTDLARLRQRFPFLARSAAVFGIPFGIYFLWRYTYYGYLFPNTFYAKTGGGWEQVELGFRYVLSFFGELRWIPLPLVCVALWSRYGRREILVLASLLVGYVAYVVAVGGDFKGTYRFFVPVLAPMWLLVVAGCAALRDLFVRSGSRGFAWVTAAAFAGCAFLALSLPLGFDGSWRWAGMLRAANADPVRRQVADWLRENTPPGEYLAQASAGFIPYYAGVPVIHLWGLTDPVIARSPRVGDWQPGHQRSNPRYVLERRPLHILLVPFHGPAPRMVEEFTGRFAVERQLLALPEFQRHYELVNEPLAGGYLHIFRRRTE